MILGRFRPGSGGKFAFNLSFDLKFSWGSTGRCATSPGSTVRVAEWGFVFGAECAVGKSIFRGSGLWSLRACVGEAGLFFSLVQDLRLVYWATHWCRHYEESP